MTDERLRDLMKRLLTNFQGCGSAFEACDSWSDDGDAEGLEAAMLEAVGWSRADVVRARDEADRRRVGQV